MAKRKKRGSKYLWGEPSKEETLPFCLRQTTWGLKDRPNLRNVHPHDAVIICPLCGKTEEDCDCYCPDCGELREDCVCEHDNDDD